MCQAVEKHPRRILDHGNTFLSSSVFLSSFIRISFEYTPYNIIYLHSPSIAIFTPLV